MRVSMIVLLMVLLPAVAAYAQDEIADETVPTPADTVVVTEPVDAGFEPLEDLQPTIGVVYRTATPVNATAEVLMSPVFPGWGQLYSDNGWRAVLAFGAEMWFWSRMLMYDRKAVRFKQYEDQATSETAIAFYQTQIPEYWELMRDNAWWSGGALLIIAVDAYVDALAANGIDADVPVRQPRKGTRHFDRAEVGQVRTFFSTAFFR